MLHRSHATCAMDGMQRPGHFTAFEVSGGELVHHAIHRDDLPPQIRIVGYDAVTGPSGTERESCTWSTPAFACSVASQRR